MARLFFVPRGTMPHPKPTQRSEFEFPDVLNSKVLSGGKLCEFVELIFNLLYGDIVKLTDKSEVLFFKVPGSNQMWTVTDVDVQWFLKCILTTGFLELQVRGPKGPNENWKWFRTDFGHWTAVLQKDLALGQAKKRQRGIFVKATKSRSAKRHRLNQRIPHL